MAKVEGLRVELSTNFVEIGNELKQLKTEIGFTDKQLKEVNKQLKFDDNDINLRTQKQKLLSQAIDETKRKIEILKLEEQQLYQQSLSGNEQEVKAWRSKVLEVQRAETALKGYQSQQNGFGATTQTSTINLANLGATFTKVTAIIGIATLAINRITDSLKQFTSFVLESVETTDKLGETAEKLNISAEALQEWQFVAKRSGLETDKLEKAIIRVNRAIGEVSAGDLTKVGRAFSELGVTINNKTSGEIFNDTILALSRLEDVSRRMYYANKIFGEDIATELSPMLRLQREEIEELIKRKRELGVLSNEEIKAAEITSDKLDELKAQYDYLMTKLGLAFLPILDKLVDFIVNKLIPTIEDIAKEFKDFSEEYPNIVFAINTIHNAFWTLNEYALKGVLISLEGIMKLIEPVLEGLDLITGNLVNEESKDFMKNPNGFKVGLNSVGGLLSGKNIDLAKLLQDLLPKSSPKIENSKSELPKITDQPKNEAPAPMVTQNNYYNQSFQTEYELYKSMQDNAEAIKRALTP